MGDLAEGLDAHDCLLGVAIAPLQRIYGVEAQVLIRCRVHALAQSLSVRT